MSAMPQKQEENQEIDLSLISKKIGSFFENISTQIFKGFLFIKRNLIIIGVLFVIGAGIGFYLDKVIKKYDHQIIVTPNFNSTDYLYAKIDLINSKIKNNDTLFLKNIVGVKEPRMIQGIAITPITDVYKFIENKDQNFELIKLMAEDGDIKKVIEENITSKNYPYHKISFTTGIETDYEKTVGPLLKYLNQSDYYALIQKEYVNNIKIKMAQNELTIEQINGVLNSFSSTVNGSQKSDKLVYYNENSQLNDVIKTKDALITEQGARRIELINYDLIIKENSSTINIKNSKAVNGKLKLVLPLLFIFIFIFIGFLKSYYRRQISKLN